jgi:D-alanine-D-alanine ligase
LIETTKKVWSLFSLRGYARVDFRIDESGKPWVLEINPNCCIAPDAGFAAAAERAGLSYADLIGRVAEAALIA